MADLPFIPCFYSLLWLIDHLVDCSSLSALDGRGERDHHVCTRCRCAQHQAIHFRWPGGVWGPRGVHCVFCMIQRRNDEILDGAWHLFRESIMTVTKPLGNSA